MSITDPLGSYARDRLDWNIAATMLGTCYIAASTQTPRIGLANLGALGLGIALYGVCAKSSTPTIDLNLSLSSTRDAAAVASTNNVYLQPLIPGAGAIDGYLTATSVAAATAVPAGIAFRSNGVGWLSFDRFPLLVIPPGSAANVVLDIFGATAAPIQTPLAVSFIWGYYKRNRLSAFVLKQLGRITE